MSHNPDARLQTTLQLEELQRLAGQLASALRRDELHEAELMDGLQEIRTIAANLYALAKRTEGLRR